MCKNLTLKALEIRKNKTLVVIKTLSNMFGGSGREDYLRFIIIFGEHSSDLYGLIATVCMF